MIVEWENSAWFMTMNPHICVTTLLPWTVWTLGSSEQGLLKVSTWKQEKSTTACRHAISIVVPSLWNGLSEKVRKTPTLLAFCKICKTGVFKSAFLGRQQSCTVNCNDSFWGIFFNPCWNGYKSHCESSIKRKLVSYIPRKVLNI